jgi:DNA-directed RNA polymerase subunit RPC12/RpoP
MSKGGWYECGDCGHEWKTRKEKGEPPFCPRCNSKNISRQETNKEEDGEPNYLSKAIGYFILIVLLLAIIEDLIVKPLARAISPSNIPVEILLAILILSLIIYITKNESQKINLK